MIRMLRERMALGVALMVGVFWILCMGASALAAEATSKGEPSVGTAAAIAVPNFLNYRNQSRVGAGVGTGEGIRTAAGTQVGENMTCQNQAACTGQAKKVEALPDDDADPALSGTLLRSDGFPPDGVAGNHPT